MTAALQARPSPGSVAGGRQGAAVMQPGSMLSADVCRTPRIRIGLKAALSAPLQVVQRQASRPPSSSCSDDGGAESGHASSRNLQRDVEADRARSQEEAEQPESTSLTPGDIDVDEDVAEERQDDARQVGRLVRWPMRGDQEYHDGVEPIIVGTGAGAVSSSGSVWGSEIPSELPGRAPTFHASPGRLRRVSDTWRPAGTASWPIAVSAEASSAEPPSSEVFDHMSPPERPGPERPLGRLQERHGTQPLRASRGHCFSQSPEGVFMEPSVARLLDYRQPLPGRALRFASRRAHSEEPHTPQQEPAIVGHSARGHHFHAALPQVNPGLRCVPPVRPILDQPLPPRGDGDSQQDGFSESGSSRSSTASPRQQLASAVTGTSAAAASAPDELGTSLEWSSSWQVADEFGQAGGMIAPRYLLVRLGERIPAETGAAPVRLSRLDAGPQWRDFLAAGRDGGACHWYPTTGATPSEVLKCPCCLSIYRQPIALPCGHSLCRGCCLQLVPAQQRRCPLCRRELPQIAMKPNLALAAVCDAYREHCLSSNEPEGVVLP
mmetsp:Transcript_74041/g.176279  ORF Transcript_74041/g.176279 Transcript_74041/m.176279 type:complete len:550 (+) Transcript_74041:147-1796(+)